MFSILLIVFYLEHFFLLSILQAGKMLELQGSVEEKTEEVGEINTFF